MAAVALFMVGRLAKFNDIFTSTVPTINNFSNHALRINCLTLFVQLKIQNNILFLYTTLFLGESVEGYLLDWKLYGSRTPSENEQMQESLQRQNRFAVEESIAAMCADRGFASQRARRQLAQEGIYDALCPRDPKQLKKRMEESQFRQLQKRRASTEGRIGVLKNRWQAGRLRSKGFANRSISVAWSVLSHNLWKVAKMLAQQDELKTKAAA